MSKKKKYTQFSIERLKKEWPFSLDLAEQLFCLNKFKLYSSLRDFFVYTALELEDEELESLEGDSFSQKNKKIEKLGICDISEYPGFFIENNKLCYEEEELVKSKVKNSTKEELITRIYNLDNIPYQTFVSEGAKFYIDKYFQGADLDLDMPTLKKLSVSLIWARVFNYLVFTTCSSSMKKMLEDQNYKKNHKGTILSSFECEFRQLKPKAWNGWRFKRFLSETEKNVLKERFFKYI